MRRRRRRRRNADGPYNHNRNENVSWILNRFMPVPDPVRATVSPSNSGLRGCSFMQLASNCTNSPLFDCIFAFVPSPPLGVGSRVLHQNLPLKIQWDFSSWTPVHIHARRRSSSGRGSHSCNGVSCLDDVLIPRPKSFVVVLPSPPTILQINGNICGCPL